MFILGLSFFFRGFEDGPGPELELFFLLPLDWPDFECSVVEAGAPFSFLKLGLAFMVL